LFDTIVKPNSADRQAAAVSAIFQPPPQGKWVNDTLLHIGYPDLDTVRPEIQRMVVDLSASVRKEAAPQFLFKSEKLTTFTDTGFQSQGLQIKSPKWAKLLPTLDEPDQVCCFALTLGNPIESALKALDQESVVRGFIWDALCSSLAEYYADTAESFIASRYLEKGLEITRRFSPGYCDLPLLSTQKTIFAFCNPETIGIQLTRSGLMIPRKSITGFVIAAKKVTLRSPCSFCSRKCDHRRLS
jgi:hypothetical protein